MATPVAVLDANVLYPARLRDLLVRLAIAGQYHARWTERILDECFDSLTRDRPDLSAEHLARTRRLMSIAMPDAEVRGYEHLVDRLDLPDPDDRHVLATALASGAGLIVTANGADFPAARTTPHGIVVRSPDEFVLQLTRTDVDAVVSVVVQQAAALRHPPMTPAEVLDGLEAVGVRRAAAVLRSAGIGAEPNLGAAAPSTDGPPDSEGGAR